MAARFPLSGALLILSTTLVLSGCESAGSPLEPAPISAARVGSDPTVEVRQHAKLQKSGEVRLDVWVGCPAGRTVLEAFVYVNQGGQSSQFTPLGVRCDGKLHHSKLLVRPSADQTFHAGAASVSGYLLLTDGTSTSPVAQIEIR